MESDCDSFDPDDLFRRFKVVEFPTCFVGLSTFLDLDVGENLNNSAYLKTLYQGRLLQFEEARQISASHRAFEILQINETSIRITFKPSTECISKAKRSKQFENRFVFDLRLIKIYGLRCCCDELHSEIGRYYISGQFEYCNLSHNPHVVDFEDVILNTVVTKYVRIRNESSLIPAKIQYVRVTGFEVTPSNLTIYPNTTQRVTISMKPTCLKIAKTLTFKVRNPHDAFESVKCGEKSEKKDENFLKYNITAKMKIIYDKSPKRVLVESLHKLSEKSKKYTYMDDEIIEYNKMKGIAMKFLNISKASYAKKTNTEKNCTGTLICYPEDNSVVKKPPADFCKIVRERISTYDVFFVTLNPLRIDFGRIGLGTQGTQEITIKNNSRYNIKLSLLEDQCVLYTDEKCKKLTLHIPQHSDVKVKIFCMGFMEGSYTGTFMYEIDNKYHRNHVYCLHVGNPTLMIPDKGLRFGMVTAESFITSVPIRIHNTFNVPINFRWDELHSDTPFEIIPSSGCVRQHSIQLCDVLYVCKPTKSKVHEVDFVSETKTPKVIPVELNVVTRKMSIKFLQPAVFFKDIPLNIEVKETVNLENSSREIVLFHVIEPLIPGLRVEPMIGTVGPKMLVTFDIIVKVSCVLEFAFDILFKINNKENVILPVSGNVIEPKILIHPKNIYMSRVPCHMITFVPILIQNLGSVKSVIEIVDTGDENMLDVYAAQGNEKQKFVECTLEGGQSKTVFVKVYDVFRREYEMYLPFRINGLLGPPTETSGATDIRQYITEYEQQYDNNPRIKLKTVTKDISFCRIAGVITVTWIQFSVENFEIDYTPNGPNNIEFTMTNVSKYFLPVSIMISKLTPNFTLKFTSEDSEAITNDNHIKFGMEQGREVSFSLKFHPKGHGRFVSTALLYLDKALAIPYSNLTFVGKRQVPEMVASCNRIICPPCYIGTEIKRTIEVKLAAVADISTFSYTSKDEKNLTVLFLKAEVIEEHGNQFSVLTIELLICSHEKYCTSISLNFHNDTGASCEVDVSFCFTECALTLHISRLVDPVENPYPYYPLPEQSELYCYMETCLKFLEKWMYQQGFRRDLYPIIPDTLQNISSSFTSQPSGTKSKGINVSYLNFIRRIAGPLMKHIRKITVVGIDDPFKSVKEIHDTYKEIINLLRSRGADLWGMQAKFLLSYDQFVVYSQNVTMSTNANILLAQELEADESLFNRLSKQAWFDFILQTYKAFVMDSCFFQCECVGLQSRDNVKILIEWYNSVAMAQHRQLRRDGEHTTAKAIENLTTDLSDGIAIISAILNFCPFMADHFSIYCEIDETQKECGIIHNASLIIEAMNMLRLNFPLKSKDFLQPNFLQMLFLSIHLYIVLPMFTPKDTVVFNPPLLKSSTRLVGISPTSQETLIYTSMIFNNNNNSFVAEKAPTGENGKKMFLSVKFTANFVRNERATLLVHGYNKTRIFDTYIIFMLNGKVGSLTPYRKCKVTGPLYRPNKVDVLVSSPFQVPAVFQMTLTDVEPSVPVEIPNSNIARFFVRRLNLFDNEVTLIGAPKEGGQEVMEQKLYLQLICLSTQIGNTWIWFQSEIGEFFIRVTTQPRWDLPLDTLAATVRNWPVAACSCGEDCECYRTTVLTVPHKNELMVKSLRYALLEQASDAMMEVFDRLIESVTGKIILGMLLSEGGTNMSEVAHILCSQNTYRITSKTILPRLDKVTFDHHAGAVFSLPITLPPNDKSEKYSITFTSECGMDVRTYRVLFIECAGEGNE